MCLPDTNHFFKILAVFLPVSYEIYNRVIAIHPHIHCSARCITQFCDKVIILLRSWLEVFEETTVISHEKFVMQKSAARNSWRMVLFVEW